MKQTNAQHWFGKKLADGINIDFCFTILLQFERKEQNLADKRSIKLLNFYLALVLVDGIQMPVLRQALNVGCNYKMKRTNLILTFVLLLLFSRTSFGQNQNDHLEPVNGIFSIYNFEFEYYSQVRKVLFKGLSDNPEIRFVTLPSFSAENVLDIELDSNSGKYYLIYHIVNESIWYAKDKSKIKVIEFKQSISKESVELTQKLFNSVVLKTKFIEDNRKGFDGTTYYFSVNNYGPKAGEIWSPDEKSKMGKFVKIAQKLITLTTNKDEVINLDQVFETEIKSLIESLE